MCCLHFPHSGNPCLCGGAPGWLAPFLDSPAVMGNATNSTNSSGVVSILQPCGAAADLLCGQSLWPPEFLRDAPQLLLLKAAATNTPTTQQLSTWRGSVPPCTNSSANASCSVCDDSMPAEACGMTRPADSVQLCNWRYIECRDRRVVTINLANKVTCRRRRGGCTTVLQLMQF